MTRHFLAGARMLVDGVWLEGHGVLVEGGVIQAVLRDGDAGGAHRVTLPDDTLLAPGLIDLQVNGGGGILFNDDPSAQAALTIAAAHRRLGTTAILPTLITDGEDVMRSAADAARAVVSQSSPVIGIHFEGPFISPERPGVHAPFHIRAPEEPDIAFLAALAARIPVLLTIAPECVPDAMLRRLANAGVVLAAGHTQASFECVVAAEAAGLRGFTHVFNAMPAPAARDPGPVAAALSLAETWCGVIADGVHVHPAMLRLLLACKRPDRIMLVSDAMPPAGTALDGFALQGRTILRRDGRLLTGDGVLAGADLCLAEAVRRVVSLCGVAPEQALAMASSVPASFLRLEHRIGRIAPGCRADLVLLGERLDVLGTWLAGEWAGDAGVLAGRAA